MRIKTIFFIIVSLSLAACSKQEYKRHKCFPSCVDITIEGKVIDSANKAVANVPFEVYFVHIPAAWVTIIPVKDRIICSGFSDQDGNIQERFTCSKSKLDDEYAVYVTFKKDHAGHGFFIDSVPQEQPVTFVYRKH